MYKIAVVGDRDSVLCFKTIGFEVYPVTGTEQAAAALKKLAGEDCAVIFVVQEYFSALRGVIEKYSRGALPAIISIPSRSGSDGSGMQSIRQAVEKAVGADISVGS